MKNGDKTDKKISSESNIKKHNVPPMLKGLDKQMEMEFDYEINSVKLDENEELNSKMFYFDKKSKSYSKQMKNN
jgi:hypothetical protein